MFDYISLFEIVLDIPRDSVICNIFGEKSYNFLMRIPEPPLINVTF